MNNPNSALNGSTARYNIKAVVSQTGLNPATIRAWERRYGFPSPHRSEGGHRQYSRRDIETLKWLIARQAEGMSISHAIDLWRSRVESGEDPIQGRRGARLRQTQHHIAYVEGTQIDQLRQAWVAACLSFDRASAEQVLEQALGRFNPETVCIELLQKGLREVGNGWYDGKVTIQQEHFTSALSVQRLEMLIAAASPATRRERIIVATAPGDFHVFSPLLLTYLLRRRGWDVIYLGADVPADEFGAMSKQVQPSLVIVSAQLLHTAAALKEIAVTFLSQGVNLAYGGQVFNMMPELQRLIPGHFLGQTMEEAIQKVDEVIRQPQQHISWTGHSETHLCALAQYRERRALIESHIWEIFVTANKPTEHLASINDDIAHTIEAALKLGDVGLLHDDISWIEHLLMGYRLPRNYVDTFVSAYYDAAIIHLDEPAAVITKWLSHLVPDEVSA